MKRLLFILPFVFSLFACCKTSEKVSATSELEKTSENCPAEIKSFMAFYPDIEYTANFDTEVNDWKIDMTADLYFERTKKPKGKKSASFYWAEGRLLPKEEIPNKENYWHLQYEYDNSLRDPKTYTAEEIEEIKEVTSTEKRRNDNGTPMFFFDFLYSAQSQKIIEDHIIQTTFLGKPTRIHERIYDQTKRIEKKILERKDEEDIKAFLANLKSCDAYHWREIIQTSRKSFHAYGIAIDILPKKLNRKAIYWSWERDKLGDKWMLLPHDKRWSPPESVIKIFEEEGFIWGGYWVIFDNMHFEYHPELIKN